MAEYRQVRDINPTQAAYIAGLIDGEGTVTLTKKKPNENRRLSVTISSTEKKMLIYVQQTLGAGLITNKKIYRSHHKPSFTYQICNRQALDLLMQVSPYLRSYKADRARIVLENYIRLTPRNGKYSHALSKERENFVEQFFAIRS